MILAAIAAVAAVTTGAFVMGRHWEVLASYERGIAAGREAAQLAHEREAARFSDQVRALEAALADRQTAALDQFIRARDVSQLLAWRSQARIHDYAQSDAGRADCLAAERVSGLHAFAAELGVDAAGDPSGAGGGE